MLQKMYQMILHPCKAFLPFLREKRVLALGFGSSFEALLKGKVAAVHGYKHRLVYCNISADIREK